MEWDDDCRVGTGEQLELEVGVKEKKVNKDEEEEEEGEEVQKLRVAWPLDDK